MFGGILAKVMAGGIIVLLIMLGVARFQLAARDRQITRLNDAIDNPDPEKGYKAKVAQLRFYIAGYKRNEDIYKSNEGIFRARIAIQNAAVDMWKAEAERRRLASLAARRDAETERASAQMLAAEIIATRPSANAALDAGLLILRAVQ
jgi:hypothetical protein